MLDISMQRVGASYVGHQNIVRYSDKSERISFIYKKGQIPTGQTLQDLAQTAERGLRNKTVADTKMAQARASNNTNMIKEAARLQVQANRDIYQTEQCLTVEISPSMNAPPVTKFQEGIPEWLAYRQTAFDLANNILTSPPQLVEVAAIATFSESVFTFTDAGGARIYVKPRSGQVFTSVRIEEEPPKPAQLPPQEQADRQQRISQQWAEFMQTGINMDQFNLSGLNDLSKQK